MTASHSDNEDTRQMRQTTDRNTLMSLKQRQLDFENSTKRQLESQAGQLEGILATQEALRSRQDSLERSIKDSLRRLEKMFTGRAPIGTGSTGVPGPRCFVGRIPVGARYPTRVSKLPAINIEEWKLGGGLRLLSFRLLTI
jgi:hypothetical protein